METVENQNVTLTDNGMITNPTSLNKCVDLFFSIGSMRGKSKDKVVNLFNEAYNENPLVASKILFWVRDVRSGAGERQTFRDVISYLTTNSPQTVRKNIGLIPEFGYQTETVFVRSGCREKVSLPTNYVNCLEPHLNSTERCW
jgi:hypothetical protein